MRRRPLLYFTSQVFFASGCATTIPFVSVEVTKGTAEVFCGYEPDKTSQMVVAVYTKEAVDDALFVVSPVRSDGQLGAESKTSKREHVYLTANSPNCVRLELPPFASGVRRFNVDVSGRAGNSHVTGSLSACEPQRVAATEWKCQPR
jgi:hypothetical protein